MRKRFLMQLPTLMKDLNEGMKLIGWPDELVQAYTLAEGQTCPALSLYLTLDAADWRVVSSETRIEAVPIGARGLLLEPGP